MTCTIHTSDAPELSDGRADAAQRMTVRMEIAEILGRVVPPLVTVYEDFEADLLPTEARDAAIDLLDELDARGYAIVRRPRS